MQRSNAGYRILTEMSRVSADNGLERVGVCTVSLHPSPLSLYNSATVVYGINSPRNRLPPAYTIWTEGRIGECSEHSPVGAHKEVIDRLTGFGFVISGRPNVFRNTV